MFHKYIRRSWIGVKYNNSEEACKQFATQNKKCIVKLMFGCGGGGVSIQNVSDIGDIKEYCRKNNVLIESLIVQHDALDKLFSNAVNTIRVMTYGGKCVGAVLRMGRGEAFVDNASSGGMIAPIDIEHGIVCGVACEYSSPSQWVIHPDTSTKIVGFEIPYWEEVIEMVNEANNLLKGIPLVGWDIAISTTGPILVEVNAGPGLALLQVTGRDDLREILKL